MGAGVKAVNGGNNVLTPLGKTEGRGPSPPPQAGSQAEANLPAAVAKAEVKEAVSKLNQASEIFGVNLKFLFHEDAKRLQVEISEAGSGKVLKKIPPDEILDLVSKMNKMIGLMIDEKR